jgi:DNA-binding NtrC family response regulator
MDDTVTLTAPIDLAERFAASPEAALGWAVVICEYYVEPWRVGDLAFCDPAGRKPLCIGRRGDPFYQQRPGCTVDHGRLLGEKLSARQLLVWSTPEGARIENVGNQHVFVDGTKLPKGGSTVVEKSAVVEIVGHSILLVRRRPFAMQPPHERLVPLHPFGAKDTRGFVGESAEAWTLRHQTAKAAESERNVMLYGESGTGKEGTARTIHDWSPRAGGTYVPVNCPTIPPDLVSLSLFGGRKNFPNPGTPETTGYFGAARGGTLFLDEIGEFPHSAQSQLLRAFEQGITRVGETEERPTPCRVVCATNRGEAGMKMDVATRVGFVVVCPSLSERREDIPLIARAHLLARLSKNAILEKMLVQVDENGFRSVRMHPELVVGLLRYALPGNVRQLVNLLDKLVDDFSPDPTRSEQRLRWPASLVPPRPEPLTPPAGPPPVVHEEPRSATGKKSRPGRELVLERLRANDWNYEKTAAELHLTVDQLFRLRRKYGIERPV